jgi:DNA-directed RNA polymerase omega subunit
MINPPLDELLKQTDNRYTLVNVAAKRARQIINEGHTDDDRSDKAVQIALEEIIIAKTKFERAKASIK